MNIEKIIKVKNNKYKIIIDGETITTYDNVILDNKLLYKKNIDSNTYKNLLLLTNYYDSYNKVVKYILKRMRSEKEVIEYLKKFELSKFDNDKIIKKLKELKLINDVSYCRAFINDKLHLSKDGLNKIRIDLLEQNIPIDIIDNELNNIDQSIVNDRLEKLILKRMNSNYKYSNFYLKQKILNEMINLGYSKAKIIEIIDYNILTDDEILEHEFNKIYNVYIKKYSGIELNNKLKNKLISKGFNINDINKLIEKKTEE